MTDKRPKNHPSYSWSWVSTRKLSLRHPDDMTSHGIIWHGARDPAYELKLSVSWCESRHLKNTGYSRKDVFCI